MKRSSKCAKRAIHNALSLATFSHKGNRWVCRAWGLEAVAFGSSKSQARSNLAQMLILVRSSGFTVARTRKHRARLIPTTESA